MKTIKLTRGYEAIVDDDCFDFIVPFNWYAFKTANLFYAARKILIDKNEFTVFMHWKIIGRKEGFVVDHVDGNGLNNVRNNLRHVTHSVNMVNSSRHKLGTSLLRGVSWSKSSKKWTSQIHVDNETIWLGCFDKENDAALSYDAAAFKYHGKFSRTNF